MRVVALGLLVAATLTGCLSNFLESSDESHRSFACAVLGAEPEELRIVHRYPGDEPGLIVDWAEGLRDELLHHAQKQPESIGSRYKGGLEAPAMGWTQDGWDDVLVRHSFMDGRNTVVLEVFWIEDPMDLGNATGRVVVPGVVAIDRVAVAAKSAATDVSEEEVGLAVLLHHVGHALGVVNRGIPMGENHEGEPGHSSHLGSVMHATWHDAGAALAFTNGTFDQYGAVVAADWQAAIADPLVCP